MEAINLQRKELRKKYLLFLNLFCNFLATREKFDEERTLGKST